MEDDVKRAAQEMLVKMMETALKHSKICVPQPFPLVDEKATKRLGTDDLISWKAITKEWQRVSPEGKKVISILLTLNSYDIIECLNIREPLCDEAKDTADYVRDHPEYEKSEEQIASESIVDDFKSMLGM